MLTSRCTTLSAGERKDNIRGNGYRRPELAGASSTNPDAASSRGPSSCTNPDTGDGALPELDGMLGSSRGTSSSCTTPDTNDGAIPEHDGMLGSSRGTSSSCTNPDTGDGAIPELNGMLG